MTLFNNSSRLVPYPAPGTHVVQGVILPYSDKVLGMKDIEDKISKAMNGIQHWTNRLARRGTHGGGGFRARNISRQNQIQHAKDTLKLLEAAKALIGQNVSTGRAGEAPKSEKSQHNQKTADEPQSKVQHTPIDWDSKLKGLKEADFDGAIKLLQEMGGAIELIFKTKREQLEISTGHIRQALEGKAEKPVFRSIREMKIDLETLPSEVEILQSWQQKYRSFVERFHHFILFMKEFHPRDKDQVFIEGLKKHYPVFKDLDQLDIFYDEYKKINGKIEADPICYGMLGYKRTGIPLNEQNYTPEIATLLAQKDAFDALERVQSLISLVYDLTAKAYGWL